MSKATKKKLDDAAKKVMREVRQHMKIDGWDLNYTILVHEVFSAAFGYNLEQHLLPRILDKRSGLKLKFKEGEILVSKKGSRK
jgi:hypothetical protein